MTHGQVEKSMDPIRDGIARALDQRAITAYELARIVGTNPQNLYAFLRGSRGLSYDLLVRVIAELGLELADKPVDQ